MLHNLTPKARQVFILAKHLVLKLNQSYLGTDHLLLALLKVKQGIAVRVLQKMGMNIDNIYNTLIHHVAEGSKSWSPVLPTENHILITPRVCKVLQLAKKLSLEWHHSYIGTEHILLGLLEEGQGLGVRLLNKFKVNIKTYREEILSEMCNEKNDEDDLDAFDEDDDTSNDEDGSDRAILTRRPEHARSILKIYGEDLTQKAQHNELDPVIGREKEIDRLIQILCRRTKNNPVLIGEAGVGKTAVVEGLAQRIANQQVPDMLLNRIIFSLDLALLLSGTKYRGQFEERLKRSIEEAKQSNMILFLDEVHTIVGAGSAEGSMDASNILKPLLARGQLQCIGATTLNEYRMYIEKDGALNRRFQAILVEQPSSSDTIKILHGLKERYEDFHHVRYSEAILNQSVALTQRYVSNRCFPDKAIDLLDEAGARTKILGMKFSPSTEALDQAIRSVREKKTIAISHQRFEEAARWRDEEQSLKAERSDILASRQKNHHTKCIPVKEETLRKIVFEWTGVPIEKSAYEVRRYLQLDKILNQSVVGQEEAIQAIVRALKRSQTDLKNPCCPIGSFLFLGPTGVGKTYLVKILAEQIFGNREAIIQIDMSEYMEKYAVSRLIGSPPGYVGHEDGGQLTEAVRRKPYSIVLFDEIEKAHPDVIQILLQVLEEGHLTDSLGRCVDFKNTILVMTSNVGAKALQRGLGLGFGFNNPNVAFEQLKSAVQDATKMAFQPEFLNRIDEIVVFHPLTREHMQAIVKLELKVLQQRLQNKGIALKWETSVEQFLVSKGFDEKMGARHLKRAIERYVEDVLADDLLDRKIKSGQTVIFHADKSQSSLSYKIALKIAKKMVD